MFGACPQDEAMLMATPAVAPPAPHGLHPVLIRLVANGGLDSAAAEQAQIAAIEAGTGLADQLLATGLVGAELWAQAAREATGCATAELADFPLEPVLPERLAARFMKRARVMPLRIEGERLVLAMVDPTDTETMAALALAAGLEVEPRVADAELLERCFRAVYEGGAAAVQRIVADLGPDPVEDTAAALGEEAEAAPVVRLVNQLLLEALEAGASDVHVEPFHERLRVRFRVHGRLREVAAPPARLAPAVVSRIKVLARLDIAERRLPQDGRTRLELGGRRLDLRVATAPTMHGESLVVRLLDADVRGVALDALGLDAADAARLRHALGFANGMILVTGPTGSGKTTTLYAALHLLNAVDRKIVSIEDPVEYQIEGVTQIPVRAEIGLGFARILRSVVRHDPDIVMVGETRDAETAATAVQAALTGHLLLTTMHTTDAAGAVGRMLDMGVEPYLLASVLRCVVGQRLVGRLCVDCRTPVAPTPGEALVLERVIGQPAQDAVLWTAPGCSRCHGLGVTGRSAIVEVLEVEDQLRELIRSRAPSQAIAAAARARGMRTMLEDGVRRALAGETTLAEVLRVTDEG
jgi:general secretion pathway protein E